MTDPVTHGRELRGLIEIRAENRAEERAGRLVVEWIWFGREAPAACLASAVELQRFPEDYVVAAIRDA